MIPSILCYLPPSVEHLGPTTPKFLNPYPRPQLSKQIDASEINYYWYLNLEPEHTRSCIVLQPFVVEGLF